jgi:hypothetical protein
MRTTKKILKNNSLKTNYTSVFKKNIFDCILNMVNAEENGSTVIVPHVCNNVNEFNIGFAKAVSEHYPIVKENFHMYTSKAKLGSTQFVEVVKNNKYGHRIIFANMIAQNGLYSPKNTRPINYAALVYCMNNVRNYVKKLEKEEEIFRVEIHSPKLGSGMSGGDWKIISELICDTWVDIKNIYIYYT